MLTVKKFGGSSLADAEKLRRAADTVLSARHRGQNVAVVVSAMGDTTDELIALAHELNPDADARELDALMSTGENQSAALLAIALERAGARAISLAGWQAGVYTDDSHGGAALELTFPSRAAAAIKDGIIPVVAGFQGVDIHGDVTTLGRGGSDTSAVALAAALGADRCEIYTDVNGVYTADPRLVPGARRVNEIDFRDMLLLARAGSQVLHPDSVELAMRSGVELLVLSSAGEPGRTAVHMLDGARRPDFAGVTRSAEDQTVTLVGAGCRSHTLPELASALSAADIRVRGGRMGEGYASVRVDAEQLIFALQTLHRYVFE